MKEAIELVVDVTDATGLGVELHTAATVFLPDDTLCDPPVVAFMFPGGGYCRRYFDFDMPGSSGGGQAGFHTARGWIVVACDHLGFGESSILDDGVLNYDNTALGNLATVNEVMRRIESGTLAPGLAAVTGAVKLGFGQSMGGCYTIVLQAHHAPFDGIAALGYSGIHTIVPSRPGTPPAVWPWFPRNADLTTTLPLNHLALAAAVGPELEDAESIEQAAAQGEHPFAWAFHYDDEPADIVHQDLYAGLDPDVEVPRWKSLTTPTCGTYMVAPGTVALEAASITVPVLSATGERDVVPDPWMEPKAFKSSKDVTVYVCPHMAHMHNFASTRYDFWRRLHSWGTAVADGVAPRS
jgi:pimeloyl-ACP methyl ester carboxylesterase